MTQTYYLAVRMPKMGIGGGDLQAAPSIMSEDFDDVFEHLQGIIQEDIGMVDFELTAPKKPGALRFCTGEYDYEIWVVRRPEKQYC